MLLTVFLMLNGLDIVLLLGQLFHGNVQRALPASIRLTLTLVLLSYLYRGFVWARVVTGVLLLVATIYGAVAAASLHSWVMWALLAPYSFSLYVVCLSPSVRKFFAAQKARRTHIPQEVPANTGNESNSRQY